MYLGKVKMTKKRITIFFLTSFLVFSFSTTICVMAKFNAQQVAMLVGNIAEEEDETEKDSKSESNDFIELMTSIEFDYVIVSNRYISDSVDPIPAFNPNILIQPPKAFTA